MAVPPTAADPAPDGPTSGSDRPGHDLFFGGTTRLRRLATMGVAGVRAAAPRWSLPRLGAAARIPATRASPVKGRVIQTIRYRRFKSGRCEWPRSRLDFRTDDPPTGDSGTAEARGSGTVAPVEGEEGDDGATRIPGRPDDPEADVPRRVGRRTGGARPIGGGGGRGPGAGAVDDPVLPLRRRLAHRHLGPEARGPGRVPRPVPADRDDGARRPALRAPADAGEAGPPPGGRQLGRRLGRDQRPPRRLLLQPDRPRARPLVPGPRQRPDPATRRLALHRHGRRLATAARRRPAERDHACPTSRAGPPTPAPASSPRGSGSSTTRSTSTARSRNPSASPSRP